MLWKKMKKVFALVSRKTLCIKKWIDKKYRFSSIIALRSSSSMQLWCVFLQEPSPFLQWKIQFFKFILWNKILRKKTKKMYEEFQKITLNHLETISSWVVTWSICWNISLQTKLIWRVSLRASTWTRSSGLISAIWVSRSMVFSAKRSMSCFTRSKAAFILEKMWHIKKTNVSTKFESEWRKAIMDDNDFRTNLWVSAALRSSSVAYVCFLSSTDDELVPNSAWLCSKYICAPSMNRSHTFVMRQRFRSKSSITSCTLENFWHVKKTDATSLPNVEKVSVKI